MLKHKVEAFSTFDVSVVEVDNLYGLQYPLVIVHTQHTQSHSRDIFFKSEMNSLYMPGYDSLINAIWTSCLKPLHKKRQKVRLKCKCQWKQEGNKQEIKGKAAKERDHQIQLSCKHLAAGLNVNIFSLCTVRHWNITENICLWDRGGGGKHNQLLTESNSISAARQCKQTN